MKLFSILFFLFILFCPSVVAADNDSIILEFLKVFDNNTWDNSFDSLNYNATKPSVVWVPGPHMMAWVDVVGFRNTSRINNIDYIYGDPVTCVLVEADVKNLLTWNDNVDWIDTQYSYNVSGGNITVTLDIAMLWHHSTEITHPNGNKGVKKDYQYAYMTLTDTERVPMQYNYTSANIPVYVLFYNNTYSPKTVINVPSRDGLYYIDYSYNNKSIRHTLMNAEIETTVKGIEFINFTDSPIWDESEGNLSHLGTRAVIKGANFTLDNLTVTLRTPYTTDDMSNYSLTVDNVSTGNCISPVLIPFMFVLALLLFTLYIIIKNIGR